MADNLQSGESTHANRRGLSKTELLGLVVLIGLPVAPFVMIFVADTYPSSPRMECMNNLKQIALALHYYEREHGSFPPAYTVDAEGNRLHSWRTLLLPYFEQQALYDTIDFSKPWDDPVNVPAHARMPKFFRCPIPELPDGHTVYQGIVSENGFFQPNGTRSRAEIADQQKLAVVEVDASRAVPWMSPNDAGEEFILTLTPETKTSHEDGTHVLRVEGSVVFLPSDVPQEKRQALLDVTETTPSTEEL